MKNTIFKIIILSMAILFTALSCEKELTRVVKKSYPSGQERLVFYYEGEPSKETWVRAEIYHENGVLSTLRRYKNGVQNGLTESYYDDGSEMAKMEYKDGKKIGPYFKKFKNGNFSHTGVYKDGLKDGDWLSMDENGDTIKIETYNIGRLTGVKRFDKEKEN
jgi:antitoxin component YwqK of YwqJK toxin-antitoxin module